MLLPKMQLFKINIIKNKNIIDFINIEKYHRGSWKKIICLLVMIFCTLNADDKDLNLDYGMKDNFFYYLGKRTFGVFGNLSWYNYLSINFGFIRTFSP